MLAEIMREPAYGAYRARLHALLQIPTDASDLEIHDIIQVGFASGRLVALCEQGELTPLERDQIIPLKTLKTRVAKDQNLTVDESDRLSEVFRPLSAANGKYELMTWHPLK